ncbi:mannosyltransferase family protein [Catellatospora vulcania]|uniref:mannosyltransferase family protein n=1 Tax=Catellatospora vulcania TaxID=1460450 RepID=UPI0012D474DF|nr:mannosyltransferase family protein [Catellatospora vulcania]
MQIKINNGESATSAAEHPNTSPADPHWKSAVRAGLAYWLVGRILVAAVEFVALAVNRTTGHCNWDTTRHGVLGDLLHQLAQFDSCNYAAIAIQGYPRAGTETLLNPGWPAEAYTAWPPVFPLLTRGFDLILPGSAVLATVIASNVAALALMIMLARLMQTELGVEPGNRAVLMFAAFPAAMFLAAGYSESTFLLFSVTCLYLARRERWWLAGLAGALAGATRVIGLVLALALLYEYLRRRGFDWRKVRLDVLAVALVPAGLALYMIFLWRAYGNPLVFIEVQSLWGRRTAPPWSGVRYAIQAIDFEANRTLAMRNIMDVVTAIGMTALLALALVGPWKLRRDQFFLIIFGALPFLFALCQPLPYGNTPLLSLNRFAIAVIPAFMVLAKMLHRRSAREAYLLAAVPIQAGLLLLFIRGSFVG